MEAESRGGFLAVSSLWSFCRCKGLYVILGKTKEEREKCANLLSIAEQHSFVIQVCLEENGSSCCLEIGKSAKEEKKKKRLKQGVCLKDNQFVFDKFLLFKNQGPVSQALRLFQSWFVKSSSRRNFCLGGGLCSCLLWALPQGLKWLQREAMIHHSCDSSDSHVD